MKLATRQQALELTKLLEEDPLWKYPEAHEISEVWDSHAIPNFSHAFAST
jgi:hypothetical protein